MKIHDRLTFICPNEIIKIRGRDVKQGAYANGLYHNLYVKEIPENMTNYDEACDASGIVQYTLRNVFQVVRTQTMTAYCGILLTLDHHV